MAKSAILPQNANSLLNKCRINLFSHFGPGGIFGTKLRVVFPAVYTLEKTARDTDSLFIDLRHLRMDSSLEKRELNLALDKKAYIAIDQNKFKKIKTEPFIYWISDDFRMKFENKSFDDYLKLATGLMTGNNLRHLRFYWEVDSSNISDDYNVDKKRWVPYQKGGDSNMWYGNNWLVVNFLNHGEQLATTDNKAFYFKDGITYSATSAKIAFRMLPENQIFDKKGSCIFPKQDGSEVNLEYILAILNSKLTNYIVGCLNSTVETQIGDIKRVPLVRAEKNKEIELTDITKLCVRLKKEINRYTLYEKEFESSPIRKEFKQDLLDFLSYENYLSAVICTCESIIDDEIFNIYDLTDKDRDMVLSKEGGSIGSLPVSNEARAEFLNDPLITEQFSINAIRDFIEALPHIEFSDEQRESIAIGFSNLYQNNNDLEAFCIRHQVNPINVWHWFKQSKVIPKQRMQTLAMEFLADMIRKILMEDEDGIIPLVPNAGEKVLLDRIEEKFLEKGFSTAQYSSFDSILGRPIHDYLNKNFFAELSDHLNLFMYLPKTPFIWHLTSGPEQGFDCYIIIYKWNRDNLLRLRSVYIENRERALQNRQSDIAGNESAEAQNEKERIFKQLKEIDAFKKKIDELLAEGYNPILDDGVGKNIAPLQKKKMLAYDVLNAGQLKKYLNADW